MNVGERVTVAIEKPAAGGRMIARHEGAILLVSGAIPGEVVEAEIEKTQRGTWWARTARVVEASPDRVGDRGDWRCGGNLLAHVAYPRQLTIKSDIVRDALTRIGRMTSIPQLLIQGSPPDGYRMRARLHVVNGRLGFFREGTHELCDARATGQLLASTGDAIESLQSALSRQAASAVAEVELSENCAADHRAVHLTMRGDAEPSRLRIAERIEGFRGVSCGADRGSRPLVLWGTPDVVDTITVDETSGTFAFTLTRQAHSFFQGNRYLLAPLVTAVVNEVPTGNVLDLYAGVGLFSVALASRRGYEVIAIEGDRAAAFDLKRNAHTAAGALHARHQSVESFLAAGRVSRISTVIVDPPRTGLTRTALSGALALHPERIVYVSCDVATLARDARAILDSGYTLQRLQSFDLFPRTAHVETLAVFES
jgi:23S rRNA (uracil1939-C5)-methyltransferase